MREYKNNPDYCELHRKDFNLEVQLFASSHKGQYGYHLFGESLLISKPVARQLVQDLDKIDYHDVIVPLIGREYNVRVSISKEKLRYKIMDNERTILLGYIYSPALESFAI